MTTTRAFVESIYRKHVGELATLPAFAALLRGTAKRADYDRFLENVVRTHLLSPQYVAFLFCVAAPQNAAAYEHNLLEELGYDNGTAHPLLLEQLACGAGLKERLPRLRELAHESRKHTLAEPLLLGNLRDVGLSAMVEISAFEFMLARLSGGMAQALKIHRGLNDAALEWFTHHSEVDVAHAEQALQAIDDYVAYHGLEEEESRAICEMTLRQNVFIKRYFGASDI